MLRIGSAAVLAALLLVTLWAAPPWATALLAVVAALAAGIEFAGFAAKIGAAVPAAFVGVAAAVVVLAFAAFDPGGSVVQHESLAIVALALVVAAGAMTLTLGPPGPDMLTRAAIMVMAPLYIGAPLGAIVAIQCELGPRATSWMIAVIAASDSAQYYTGRLFGRRRLAPIVSPSKTVEGAVGGVVVATLAGVLVGRVWLPQAAPAAAAGLALTMAAFGIVGDLFESMLKRSAGVKDASQLIPGHGGVLDRIDSYLFAAPVFYIFLRCLT